MTKYPTDARSYLSRARKRLDEGTAESLFYAAFELRCGIVQRMRQYLDTQAHVSEKKKQGWRVPDLGRTIEKTLKVGDKVAKITVADRTGKKLDGIFYYTPVTSELRSIAGKLGNYLHAAEKYRDPEDVWWQEIRAFFEVAYTELRRACIGTLLGPPLVSPKGMIMMPMELDDNAQLFTTMGEGAKLLMNVEFLVDYPKELERTT